MTTDKDFVRRFGEVVGVRGWRPAFTPTEVVAAWEQFVDRCAEGYDDSIYEYENDLAVRDLIEALLTDQELAAMDQMDWFRSQVAAADQRYAALLQPGSADRRPERPWWRAGILRFAGEELATDLESRYGTPVEVS